MTEIDEQDFSHAIMLLGSSLASAAKPIDQLNQVKLLATHYHTVQLARRYLENGQTQEETRASKVAASLHVAPTAP